ncbi:MAG: hypothetical protein AAB533_00515 [Patescibacteria group bacterium]
MEDIQTVEFLEEEWSTCGKDQIFEHKGGKYHWIGFAAEIGKFRVQLWVSVGKRGGIAEETYVVDPTQRIVVDRLRLAERITEGDGHFLPLRNMRDRVRRGNENAILVTRECVAKCLGRIKAGEFTEVDIGTMREKIGTSPYCVSGGLGSLGKRK